MLFRFYCPDALAVDFEQVIVSVILFIVLFADQIMICSTSAAHMPLMLFCLLNPSALAANFEQVIVPVICFLPCLLTRCLFVSFLQPFVTGFVSFAFTVCFVTLNRWLFFEQVIVPVLLYLALFVN